MTTPVEIMKKLETVFNRKQTEVLTDVIANSYKELVKARDFKELKDDFHELKDIVKELALAQKRTEERIEELTEAQKRTESEMKSGFKSLSDQIAALGSRWGIYNEATFRGTIKGILEKQEGITITSGYYGDREVDVIIRNGEHILLEITSRMKHSDIEKILASGDDYRNQHGIEPLLMVATGYISPRLMQKIMSLPRKIDIFSYEGEEE